MRLVRVGVGLWLELEPCGDLLARLCTWVRCGNMRVGDAIVIGDDRGILTNMKTCYRW